MLPPENFATRIDLVCCIILHSDCLFEAQILVCISDEENHHRKLMVSRVAAEIYVKIYRFELETLIRKCNFLFLSAFRPLSHFS